MTPERAYPLNAWYPAAWSHEIGRALFARKICDADIVLYRRQDGAAGRRWRTPAGTACCRCRSAISTATRWSAAITASSSTPPAAAPFMPAQKTINPSAGVRAYPVVERHRLVWVWPGDPALADPA